MRPDFITFASDWHGGQASMLYAVASTGDLTRGTIRPRNDDGEPMSDEEWIRSLWGDLASELRSIRRQAKERGQRSPAHLNAFLAHAERMEECAR